MFRRADLATRYVEGGRDLADVLFTDGVDGVKLEASEAAGRMVRTLARAGVRHVDLNLKNLLYVSGGNPALWVLDLDRCQVTADGSAVDSQPMLARLLRSLAKWERRTGRPVNAAVRGAIEAGHRA
jgi:tRNA A-37 threonylcarbamoyl transferase component Bud32